MEKAHLLDDKRHFVLLVAVVLVLVVNQLLTMSLFASLASASGDSVKVGSVNLEYGSKMAIGPVLLSQGEQAAIAGYRTRIKSLPTISALSSKQKTGDATQDLINNAIPTGTPSYGQEAGISFDDPLGALQKWGQYERSIKLSAEEEARWKGIVGSFTCDFCCGSPQNPTIITNCGCAHAAAWRGMAKWFLKYHPEFSDLEIFGEMTRWKTLWYPGPVIQRVLAEASV